MPRQSLPRAAKKASSYTDQPYSSDQAGPSSVPLDTQTSSDNERASDSESHEDIDEEDVNESHGDDGAKKFETSTSKGKEKTSGMKRKARTTIRTAKSKRQVLRKKFEAQVVSLQELVASGGFSLLEHERQITELVGPEIEYHGPLSNMQAFDKLVELVRIRHVVEKPTSPLPILVDDFLAREKYRDLAVVKKKLSSKHGTVGGLPMESSRSPKRWRIALVDVSDGHTLVRIQNAFQTITLPVAEADTGDAVEIGDVFVRLCERVPILPTKSSKRSQLGPTAFYWTVLTIARNYLFPDHERHNLNAVSGGWKFGKLTYSARITITTTHGICERRTYFTVPEKLPKTQIPPITGTIKYGKLKSPKPVIPDGLSPEEHARHQYAVDLVNYCGYLVSGKMFEDRNSAEAFLQDVIAQINPARMQTGGLYRGKPLYYKSKPYTGFVVIRPSNSVQHDLEAPESGIVTKINVIIVHADSHAVASPVYRTLESALMNGLNILDTWRLGCIAADAVNESRRMGEDTIDECQCTESQKAFTMHYCGYCGNRFQCVVLEWSCILDTRVCATCHELVEDVDETKSRHFCKLLHEVRREQKLRGAEPSTEAEKAETGKILESIPGPHDPTIGSDDVYIPGVFRRAIDWKNLKEERFNPFIMSYDAVFPFHLNVGESRVVVHGVGNVVPTSRFFNLFKGIHTPGATQNVAKLEDADVIDPSVQELLGVLDEIHQVTMSTPHNRQKRLCQKVSRKQYARKRYEWITGRLHRLSQRKERRLLWQSAKPPTNMWKPHDFDTRLGPLISAIIEKFPQAYLRYGEDGCPYAFDGEMPTWNYWIAWSFFAERLRRMWLYCNGFWILVDVIETLFLEALWQYLEGRRGLFRLPYNPFSLHPLCVAMSHDIHGYQLRSSWKVPRPQSIDDRDETLNNLKVQTAMENRAESNYPLKFRTQLQEEFRKIKIPKEYYDPDLEQSSKIYDRVEDSDVEHGVEEKEGENDGSLTEQQLQTLIQEAQDQEDKDVEGDDEPVEVLEFSDADEEE